MDKQPSDNLVTLTYLIYGLHLFSAMGGILSPAFIITAFLTGWPSIIAVLLNYLKSDDVTGSYLASHFRWQIRTFWFALLWMVVAGILMLTVIGIPFALIILAITGVWVLYRIIKGLLRLTDRQAMRFDDSIL